MPPTAPAPIAAGPASNAAIAARLRTYAGLLAVHDETPYRARAYSAAARTLEALDEPVGDILSRGGIDALVALPTIGEGIAAAIAEMLVTGRWAMLERLRGETPAEAVLRSLPGIGQGLAAELVDNHDIETLEELETALHDESVRIRGIGPRRREALIAALAQRLAPLRRPAGPPGAADPPVATLLDADALYAEKAASGALRRIAPRRFNPEGAAWLPVMHARRGDWHLTLMWSNTARAHALGRTRDWVVVYARNGSGPERRFTVVTETKGPLRGRRVVRGRESECADHYAAAATAPDREERG